DMITQEVITNTLSLISENGTDYFYNGEIADALANTVQEFEGSMTMEDMQGYDVTVDDPVWGQYKDYDIATMPPPSSGGIFLLQMLGIVDGFDLSQYDIQSVEKCHLYAVTLHVA